MMDEDTWNDAIILNLDLKLLGKWSQEAGVKDWQKNMFYFHPTSQLWNI